MLINLEGLRLTVEGLWNRINRKFLAIDGYQNANVDTLNAREIILSSASLQGALPVATTANNIQAASSRTIAGWKNAVIEADTLISKVQIGVIGYDEGELVEGIQLYVVDSTTNTVLDRLTNYSSNVTGSERYPEEGNAVIKKFVNIPLNKSYASSVYLIASIKRVSTSKGMALGSYSSRSVAFDLATEEERLEVGQALPSSALATSGRFFLTFGDKTFYLI